MKKLFLLLVAVLTLQLSAKADDKPIQFEQLPVKAQGFVKKHFVDKKISYSKVDNEILDKSYSIVFVDGSSIDFTKAGEWKEIECKANEVPQAIVPVQIKNYIQKNYPDMKILKIDRDKKYYEVELSNKLELKFDMKFNLVKLDM